MAGDLRVDEHAFLDFVPVAQFDGHAGQGQIVKALFGVEPLHDDFDRVARLRRRLERAGGQAALLATAELDEDFVAPQGDDAAAMPRLRLQDAFRAAAFTAGHQVVQRQAAHGPIQLGLHGGRELLPAAGNHGRIVFVGGRRTLDRLRKQRRLRRRKRLARHREVSRLARSAPANAAALARKASSWASCSRRRRQPAWRGGNAALAAAGRHVCGERGAA